MLKPMSEQTTPTPHTPQAFTEVQRIAESRGAVPHTVDQLDALVEAPLLPAARELYEKGVRTTESSANPESNDEGYGWMTIEYDTLSEENKQVVASLIQDDATLDPASRRIHLTESEDGYTAAVIQVPLKGGVDDIATYASAIAHRFLPQPMLWAPRYTLSEIKELYSIAEEEEATPEDFLGEGFYYDQPSGLFFLSEDHARRALIPRPADTSPPPQE